MGFVIALRVVRIGMIALPDLALELSAGVAWIAIVIPSGYSLLAAQPPTCSRPRFSRTAFYRFGLTSRDPAKSVSCSARHAFTNKVRL